MAEQIKKLRTWAGVRARRSNLPEPGGGLPEGELGERHTRYDYIMGSAEGGTPETGSKAATGGGENLKLPYSEKKYFSLGDPWLPNMAYSFCSWPEKCFLQGTYAIERGDTSHAIRHFDRAYRSDGAFYDAAFMSGALKLCLGKTEEARQLMLRIIYERLTSTGRSSTGSFQSSG